MKNNRDACGMPYPTYPMMPGAMPNMMPGTMPNMMPGTMPNMMPGMMMPGMMPWVNPSVNSANNGGSSCPSSSNQSVQSTNNNNNNNIEQTLSRMNRQLEMLDSRVTSLENTVGNVKPIPYTNNKYTDSNYQIM